MKRRPVDYVALRGLITPRAVLEMLGWRPSWARGDLARWPCPFEPNPTLTSRRLWTTQTGYYCHSCHVHGDAVDLWRRLQGLDVLTAAYDLCERLKVAVPYR